MERHAKDLPCLASDPLRFRSSAWRRGLGQRRIFGRFRAEPGPCWAPWQRRPFARRGAEASPEEKSRLPLSHLTARPRKGPPKSPGGHRRERSPEVVRAAAVVASPLGQFNHCFLLRSRSFFAPGQAAKAWHRRQLDF